MTLVKPFQTRKSIDSSFNNVSFDRKELAPILKIYGQMVSKGEWRDYSISCSVARAIFSIFRRSSENPLYMIIKTPQLSNKAKMYSIVAMNGRIIKQGSDLTVVLKILNKKLYKIV